MISDHESEDRPGPGAGRRVVILTSAAGQEDPGYIRGLVRPGDVVIAADGGAGVALNLGLRPDLVVGDLDSIHPEDLERVRELCPVENHPARKDKTDTHLALERALDYRPGEVVVAGAFGDRTDHVLGLVLLVAGLKDTPLIRLAGARQEGFVLTGAARLVSFSGSPGDTVSLLPLSPVVTGVTTEGLGYPLSGGTLRWGETLGVSNEMTTGGASVRVGAGVLLVVRLEGSW